MDLCVFEFELVIKETVYNNKHTKTKKHHQYHRLFSLDSGLEAFSLNPARGSFAALTFQSTALPIVRTNGSSRTKLDYCHVIDFISRVKLTCLTTV